MSVISAPSAQQQRDYFATHELAPTDDNIIKSLTEDKFGRNEYLKHFLCFLDHIHYSCSIAIDGQWGCGKSFFVKQAKALLEYYNPQIKTADIAIVDAAQLELTHSFLPIYYDAWANDNANDPFLSLIHTIATDNNVLSEDRLKGQVPFLKKAAAFVDMICDTNIKEFYEQKDADDLLAEIKKQKDFERTIHEFLDSCKPEVADRIVIFIDELDRCRPSFAVQLLERVKHYFSYEDVTFVLSINSAELEHTIRAFYGQDFDAHRYLDRFFDYRVELPEIDHVKFMCSIQFDESVCSLILLNAVIQCYHLSIREAEKLSRALNVAGGIIENRQNLGLLTSYNRIFYHLFLPIILGLKMVSTSKFRQFINGKNPQLLNEIRTYSEETKLYFQNFQTTGGYLLKDSNTTESLYREFFSQDSDMLARYMDIVNMLSPYASYH